MCYFRLNMCLVLVVNLLTQDKIHRFWLVCYQHIFTFCQGYQRNHYYFIFCFCCCWCYHEVQWFCAPSHKSMANVGLNGRFWKIDKFYFLTLCVALLHIFLIIIFPRHKVCIWFSPFLSCLFMRIHKFIDYFYPWMKI